MAATGASRRALEATCLTGEDSTQVLHELHAIVTADGILFGLAALLAWFDVVEIAVMVLGLIVGLNAPC